MIKNDCPNQVIKMGNNIINFDKFLLSTESILTEFNTLLYRLMN